MHRFKMSVKGKSRFDPQGAHNGETGAIRVAEILVLILEKQFPGFVFVFPPHRQQRYKAAALQSPAKLGSSRPTQPSSEQGDRFIENKIGRQQRGFIISEKGNRPGMIGIFFVYQGIPGAGVHEKTFHLERPFG